MFSPTKAALKLLWTTSNVNTYSLCSTVGGLISYSYSTIPHASTSCSCTFWDLSSTMQHSCYVSIKFIAKRNDYILSGNKFRTKLICKVSWPCSSLDRDPLSMWIQNNLVVANCLWQYKPETSSYNVKNLAIYMQTY